MDAHLHHLIESIHASPTKAVIYVTGGAASALSWLLNVPGASGTVLEALVPYSWKSFSSTIPPQEYANLSGHAKPDAARALAAAAYRRAVKLAEPGTPVVGIAASCTLSTHPPRRGSNRAYITAHAAARVVDYGLEIAVRDSRQEEDILASRLLLQAIADATVESPLGLLRESPLHSIRDLLTVGDRLSPPQVYEFPDPIRAVVSGDAQFAELCNGVWNRDACHASMVLPGSFNPIHDGHFKLMMAAKALYPNDLAAYEISISNADKETLEEATVRNRLAQFPSTATVIVSRAPLFPHKAELYGGVRFVVGVDTASRIVSPTYYTQNGLMNALVQLKVAGCSFVVGGRLEQRKDGVRSTTFQTMQNVDVPPWFQDMFTQIEPKEFRVDVSSSEIRASQGELTNNGC